MNNKKIWIICHYATPLKYGHGARHFLLAEEFVRSGYDVTVFASTSNFQLEKLPETKGVFTHESVNGIEVVWVKGIRYRNPAGIVRIMSWFLFSFLLLFYRPGKKSSPAIVIVSSLSLVPVINGFLYKRMHPSTQFIFEVRDIWPQTLIDIGGYSRHNPLVMLLGMIEKLGYKSADNIVATMPRADLHIARRIGNAFSFKCIPQGIHPQQIKDSDLLQPSDYDKLLPSHCFVVGYAGAIGTSNCLDTLIESARIISSQDINDICFALLGEGNAKDELISRARGLRNVIFLPKVGKDKVQSFLSRCSLLHDSVRPVPLYDYGLSRNKWMDYMLSGKPLVVSYSGYVSLINEANCGAVVPAGDAPALASKILEFYRMDRDELAKMGQRGRHYVLTNRTFGNLAREYMEIFWSGPGEKAS